MKKIMFLMMFVVLLVAPMTSFAMSSRECEEICVPYCGSGCTSDSCFNACMKICRIERCQGKHSQSQPKDDNHKLYAEADTIAISSDNGVSTAPEAGNKNNAVKPIIVAENSKKGHSCAANNSVASDNNIVLADSRYTQNRELKHAEALSVSEIIDVLSSGFSYQEGGWKCSGKCRDGWSELYFSREGSDLVRVIKADLYYRPVEFYYQTLRVTGPILKYTTTVNVCQGGTWDDKGTINCDSVMLNEVEVVSRRLIKVNQTVLKGGAGAGVADGEILSCTYEKRW